MDEQPKNLFVRFIRLLKETPLRVGFFLLFLLAFSWPYLSFLEGAEPAKLFGYFFGVWLVLIGVLWLSNSFGEDTPNEKK